MIGVYLFENQYQSALWVDGFEELGYFGNSAVSN